MKQERVTTDQVQARLQHCLEQRDRPGVLVLTAWLVHRHGHPLLQQLLSQPQWSSHRLWWGARVRPLHGAGRTTGLRPWVPLRVAPAPLATECDALVVGPTGRSSSFRTGKSRVRRCTGGWWWMAAIVRMGQPSRQRAFTGRGWAAIHRPAEAAESAGQAGSPATTPWPHGSAPSSPLPGVASRSAP